jgi:hypothetical protein
LQYPDTAWYDQDYTRFPFSLTEEFIMNTTKSKPVNGKPAEGSTTFEKLVIRLLNANLTDEQKTAVVHLMALLTPEAAAALLAADLPDEKLVPVQQFARYWRVYGRDGEKGLPYYLGPGWGNTSREAISYVVALNYIVKGTKPTGNDQALAEPVNIGEKGIPPEIIGSPIEKEANRLFDSLFGSK